MYITSSALIVTSYRVLAWHCNYMYMCFVPFFLPDPICHLRLYVHIHVVLCVNNTPCIALKNSITLSMCFSICDKALKVNKQHSCHVIGKRAKLLISLSSKWPTS